MRSHFTLFKSERTPLSQQQERSNQFQEFLNGGKKLEANSNALIIIGGACGMLVTMGFISAASVGFYESFKLYHDSTCNDNCNVSQIIGIGGMTFSLIMIICFLACNIGFGSMIYGFGSMIYHVDKDPDEDEIATSSKKLIC
jgi:hypothetical protein